MGDFVLIILLFQVSPTPSQESLVSQHSGQSGEDPGSLDPTDDGSAPFMTKPFCVYTGHSADMLDISWSKVICSLVSYLSTQMPVSRNSLERLFHTLRCYIVQWSHYSIPFLPQVQQVPIMQH